jgi:hypothetical protein
MLLLWQAETKKISPKKRRLVSWSLTLPAVARLKLYDASLKTFTCSPSRLHARERSTKGSYVIYLSSGQGEIQLFWLFLMAR